MSPLDANALTPILRDALARSAPDVAARAGDGMELIATTMDTLTEDIEIAQQQIGGLDAAHPSDRITLCSIAQRMLDQADAMEQLRAAVATGLEG